MVAIPDPLEPNIDDLFDEAEPTDPAHGPVILWLVVPEAEADAGAG